MFSPNTGKCGPEITPYLDTFQAVLLKHSIYWRLSVKNKVHKRIKGVPIQQILMIKSTHWHPSCNKHLAGNTPITTMTCLVISAKKWYLCTFSKSLFMMSLDSLILWFYGIHILFPFFFKFMYIFLTEYDLTYTEFAITFLNK